MDDNVSEKRSNEDWQIFSGQIGKAILKAIQERGMTAQAFAREMGYTQPAVSSVFNPKMPQRCWSGPMLLAAARVLRVRVSDIIRAAELVESTEDGVIDLFLGDRPPCSEQRLAGLINWAVPEGTPDSVRETFYNVDMMKTFFSELVERYYAGDISDARLMMMFRAALEASGGKGNLWTALKKYRGDERESPQQ